MNGQLYNPSTGVTATPNANVTPQQVAGAKSLGFTSPVPATIDASRVSNVTPTTIPQTSPTIPSTTTVPQPTGTTTDANGNAIQPTTDTSGTDNSGFLAQIKKMIGLGDTLATEGTVRTQLENDQQLSTKQAQATSDYNAYNKAKIDQTNQIDAMRQQAGGTVGGNNEAVTAYQRSSDAHIANLAYASLVSQGLYDSATKAIQDKYDAIFQPVKDQIDYITKYISDTNNDLTEKERLQMTNQNDAKKAELADVTKTANDIGTQLQQNNAPVAVHDAIDKIMLQYSNGTITAQSAKSQMQTAAGSYGVDQSKLANTQVVDIGNKKVLINTQTGNTIKVLGSVSTGLSSSATNDAAVRAGVDLSTFTSYPTDVQAFFSQTNDANIQPVKDLLTSVATGGKSAKDASSEIDKMSIAPAVKTFLKSQAMEAETQAKKLPPQQGFFSKIWNAIF